MELPWKKQINSYDDRRDIIIPGNADQTLIFSVEHFITIAQQSIDLRGQFCVALSGGSTPKAIYQLLATNPFRSQIDWSHVKLFWSDERNVEPENPDSNFLMAMQAGFSSLPLLSENIFRMPANAQSIEKASKDYERTILEHVPYGIFDLVMLGMGEDGHTASLFPKTHGLHVDDDRLAVANFITQKNMWRMTLTFECINQARYIAIYVLGSNKAPTLKHVLISTYDPDSLPVQRVGTRTHKALWIADQDAAKELTNSFSG